MTSDNVIPMPSAMQAAPVIIDDSRLQALWRQQHRRQNWIVGGAVATALLIAGALVVMAFRLNNQPAPVNITVPEQPAPVVNITNPPPTINIGSASSPTPAEQPATTARDGESKVVSEYTKFTTATVGKYEVASGWNYHSSKDTTPYTQYCYVHVGRTGRLNLAVDMKPLTTIDADARALGIDSSQVEAMMKSCRWFSQELRDPANK